MNWSSLPTTTPTQWPSWRAISKEKEINVAEPLAPTTSLNCHQETLGSLLSSGAGCFLNDCVPSAARGWQGYVVIQIDNRATSRQLHPLSWHDDEVIRPSLLWNALYAKKHGYRYHFFIGPETCTHPSTDPIRMNQDLFASYHPTLCRRRRHRHRHTHARMHKHAACTHACMHMCTHTHTNTSACMPGMGEGGSDGSS